MSENHSKRTKSQDTEYRSEEDQITDTSSAEDSDVKLTDISDIVAKYAVVDKVFDDDDPDDDADDDDSDIFEEPEEVATVQVRPSFLPERPKIVFRRPSDQGDLHSKWAHNAKQAVSDMHTPHLDRVSVDHDDGDDRVTQHPAVLQRHRRNLARTLTVSIGLPVAGGAVFALLLYLQKDIKPTDVWAWFASSTTGPVVSESAPTPNFALHPEGRKTSNDTSKVAAMTPTREPVSPESGVAKLDTRVTQPVQQAKPALTSAPTTSPNPVYMAQLTVSDTEGSSLAPIPLSLAVAPGVPEQRLRIRISGLPKGARLSNGSDLGHGEWLLRDNDLENLNMTLAPEFSGRITLLAEVIDDATHIQAAPSQMVSVNVKPEQVVAEPVAASPNHSNFAEAEETPPVDTALSGPTSIVPKSSPFAELQVEAPTPGVATKPRVAALAPATETETDEITLKEDTVAAPALTNDADVTRDLGLIGKGDVLLTNGDIASARLFYKRALKDGDPRAATAIGRSYDPVIYEDLEVRGVAPDPNQAVEWYRRGAEAGDTTAKEHLQALGKWLKR